MSTSLKCPQCGASESTLLQDNIYQCKFCGTIYEYGDKDTPRETINPTSFNPDSFKKLEDVKNTANKATGCVVLGITLAIFVAAGAIIFTARVKTGSSSSTTSSRIFKDYNESNNSFTVVNSINGPKVWSVSRRNSDGLKEVSYYLNLIDPKENKIIKSEQIGNTITWDQSFKDDYSMGQLKPIGNICWLLFGQDNLLGYNVNTQKQVASSTQLSDKFTELKAGIAKVEEVYDIDGFKFTTKDGFTYYYLPEQEKLMTEDDYNHKDKATSNDITITQYGFTEGERQQLYRLDRKVNSMRKDKIYSSEISEIAKDRKNISSYKVSNMEEFTPGRIYFNASVLYQDANKLIIIYQTESGDNGPVQVQCLDAFRKVLWTKDGEDVKILKPVLKQGNTESFLYKQELVVIQPYQIAVCLNVEDGTTLWSFKPY